MLTFGDEVEMFWKRKFTGATAMFLLNRYLILISYVLELVSVWIKSDYVSGVFSCYLIIVGQVYTSTECQSLSQAYVRSSC